MTLSEYLRGLSNYPLSEEALQSILSKRGGMESEYVASPNSYLAEADLYRWLSTAPDISQGGQSYNLSDSTRDEYRRRANELYKAYGNTEDIIEEVVIFGYKGSRL